MRAASNGDEAARSAFARGYAMPIRAYLLHRWRGRPVVSHVEDAVQDVFVECYKPGGVLHRADPTVGEFRALLYGVARNVARRHEESAAKSIRRSAEESVDLDELPHQTETRSRVFDRAWAQSLLREAVELYRAAADGDPGAETRFRILRLRHDVGLPIREVAAALGEADVARIHIEYRRARREFVAHLRIVVATHTGVTGVRVEAECRRLAGLLGD